MSEEHRDDHAIVRVTGKPRQTDKVVSRRDLVNFHALANLVGKKFQQGGELAEEYIRARVAQETNAAAQAAAEAAEIASRKEENEARANLTRQQAVSQFVDNLGKIQELSPVAQAAAVCKLIADNPELSQQLDAITEVADRLQLTRGVVIAQSRGVIKKLSERGFGFIEGEAGDIFFHSSAVEGTDWSDLKKGQQVTYTEGQGPKGPRAENVKPIE